MGRGVYRATLVGIGVVAAATLAWGRLVLVVLMLALAVYALAGGYEDRR